MSQEMSPATKSSQVFMAIREMHKLTEDIPLDLDAIRRKAQQILRILDVKPMRTRNVNVNSNHARYNPDKNNESDANIPF